ncbi:MAG: DMT family transporter, partial [Candidatus Diapherotrites archaeon]|nr:DMT family transporter [Candidatus Diapherotrites archaeon]
NIKESKLGLLKPLKALIEDKGAKIMLFIAFVWGISSVYDKIGIQNSSPIFLGIVSSLFLTIGLFPLMLWKSKNITKQIRENFKPILLSGVAMAFLVVFQMIAMSLALVVYVIAIKRTSTLISTFFGWLFFKEKNIKSRLLGAVIMFVGVLFITLF